MKLLVKLNNLKQVILNKIRLVRFKSFLGKSLEIGTKAQFKNTSRINVWGKYGKVIIGNNFSMGFNSELYAWDESLIIGRGTSLNDNCKIYGKVSIGDNCLFASNIFISSGTHNFLFNPYLPIKQQDKLCSISREVIVEDDCWLGFGVVIMPGVHIGKGAIIGSNSVVTKDVFPYTINAGIPNREIGKRLEFSRAFDEINSITAEHWPFFYKGFNYGQYDDLDSLKNGIEVIDSTAVFLVVKNITNKIRIKGISYNEMKLNVFLNTYQFGAVQVNEGFFDVNLNLVFQDNCSTHAFHMLSNDVKDKFGVIVIESYTIDGSVLNKGSWKVLSIGYNEN